jgi:hypothetical protein
MPWEFQRQVALVPNAGWEEGAGALANEIGRIEEAFWEERLPQHEVLSQDQETGKFRLGAKPFGESASVERWLKQFFFAVTLAVDTNSSDINRMCTAFKYLIRMLENCRDDPNAIEQHLGIARGIIDENIEMSG